MRWVKNKGGWQCGEYEIRKRPGGWVLRRGGESIFPDPFDHLWEAQGVAESFEDDDEDVEEDDCLERWSEVSRTSIEDYDW